MLIFRERKHSLRGLCGRASLAAMAAAAACLAGAASASATPAVTAVPAATHAAGLVLAWGDNQFGELGDGTTTPTTTPVDVRLPSGTRVSAVAAGFFHGLALTPGGRAFAWGTNYFGELGNGSTTPSATPVSVLFPAGTRVIAVAAGDFHNLALTRRGGVLAWGGNQNAELGDGTTANRTTPVPVSLPPGTRIRAIGAGSFHSLAVTSRGRVLAWGSNDLGQLGNGGADTLTPVPVQLPAGTRVTAVAGGDDFSLALTSDGRVFAWGFNGEGQLGDGTTTTSTVPVQVHLPAGTRVRAIAAGGDDSLAVTTDGRALAWGGNDEGQLGDGTGDNRSLPVFVHLPAGTRVTGIAGGEFHSVAVTTRGRLLAWGGNSVGQLGNGGTTGSLVPTPVDMPAFTRASAVAARGDFSLAVAARACGRPAA